MKAATLRRYKAQLAPAMIEELLFVVPNHWNPSFHVMDSDERFDCVTESHFDSINEAVKAILKIGRVPAVHVDCKRWASRSTTPEPASGVDARQEQRGDHPERGYFGSKDAGGVAERIINQIPPHDVFIEAFAGMAAVTRRKLPASRSSIVIDSDPETCRKLRRIPGVTVINDDAVAWLEKHRGSFSNTVVYLDPPYLFATRSSGKRKRYGHEFGEEWLHGPMLGVLTRLTTQGVPTLINHPRHPLYDKMLGNWRVIDYAAPTHGGLYADALWCNFPEPTRLHDYRFVGDGFRERERIKRKLERWKAKFRGLSPIEQTIILDALSAGIAKNGDAAD